MLREEWSFRTLQYSILTVERKRSGHRVRIDAFAGYDGGIRDQ